MIILKSERDLEAMRPACQAARAVLDEVTASIVPGMTTKEIDQLAASRIRSHGARSAFLGYRKYPCNICISVNDQVVHGLAGERRVEFGDIVSLDVAAPRELDRRCQRWWRDIGGLREIAIDDVVMFGQGDMGGTVAAQLVAHLDENQRAGAARLLVHINDGRCA